MTISFHLSYTVFVPNFDIDFKEYRRKHDNKNAKKALTIPSWLDKMTESNNTNFSRMLEEALINKLNL